MYFIIRKLCEKACSFSLVSHGTSEKAQVLLLTQGLFLMDAGRVAFMFCVHKVDILRVWVTGPSGGSGQRKLQQLWRWNQGREQRAHETWLRCSFVQGACLWDTGVTVIHQEWGRKSLQCNWWVALKWSLASRHSKELCAADLWGALLGPDHTTVLPSSTIAARFFIPPLQMVGKEFLLSWRVMPYLPTCCSLCSFAVSVYSLVQQMFPQFLLSF